MDEKLVDAITKLLETALKNMGVGWTITLIVFIVVFVVGWKLWSAHQRKQESQAAIDALNGTIQILAGELRETKALLFKQLGMSEEAIDAILIKNRPKNAEESRKLLEAVSRKPKVDKKHQRKGKGKKK